MMRWLRRRQLYIATLAFIWMSLLPPATLAPQAALAESDTMDVPQATGGDVAKEIIYTDNNGFIRVFDPYHSGQQVQWVSPTGNWRSIAVGDFNNDGDMEIVAVRGAPGDAVAPELAIFDPVVARGSTPADPKINGIPWRQLASIPLPSKPELVFAGNFDPNVPGDEIGVLRAVVPGDNAPSGTVLRAVIYKQTSPMPDGTSWTVHQFRDFSEPWERVAVGNLDRAGGDEVAFVSPDKGEFAVFRPDAGFSKISGPGGSSSRPFRDVAFAQFYRGGNLEILAVRKQDNRGSPTFEVYTYDGTRLNLAGSDVLVPGPSVIFAGDINNANEDDEAMMIRKCSGDCARFIVRNDGGDGVIQEFLNGLRLDDDDGWSLGAAGDIDGDSRAEIVLIRDNKIRWYPDAHNSPRFEEINAATNRRNIVLGDVDRIGFIAGPSLAANPASVTTVAYKGFTKTGTIQLQNPATADAIPFTATRDREWLSVTPTSGFAPGNTSAALNLTYQIDTTLLVVGQQYTGALIFSSPNATNSPLTVPFTVTIEYPPFGAAPSSLTALYLPCEEPLAEKTMTVQVVGVPGNRFKAKVLEPVAAASALQGELLLAEPVEGGFLLTDRTGAQAILADPGAEVNASASSWPSEVAWVSNVTSTADTLPATLTMTISPTLRTTNFERAFLFLRTPDPQNPGSELASLHPIVLMCTSNGLWMPVIAR